MCLTRMGQASQMTFCTKARWRELRGKGATIILRLVWWLVAQPRLPQDSSHLSPTEQTGWSKHLMNCLHKSLWNIKSDATLQRNPCHGMWHKAGRKVCFSTLPSISHISGPYSVLGVVCLWLVALSKCPAGDGAAHTAPGRRQTGKLT